jgi:hypothetical protein
MMADQTHFAVKLGQWLCVSRRSKGFVKRVFANEIFLSPSQYSEVEAGVVSVGSRQSRKRP